MTIGPAPMIRMVEMSVLLGIKSRGWQLENRHKKRARIPRVPQTTCVRQALAREASLDQISQPRNPQKRAVNRHFVGLCRHVREGVGALPAWSSPSTLSPCSSYAGHALPRRSGVAAPRVARQGESGLPAVARDYQPAFARGFGGGQPCTRFASEGWRPGLDLNQDKEQCNA